MPARLLAVVCCIICGATFAPLHFTRQLRRLSSPAPSPSPAVSPSLTLSLPASLLLLLLHATLSTRRRVTRAPSTHEMDSPCLASQPSLYCLLLTTRQERRFRIQYFQLNTRKLCYSKDDRAMRAI